MHNIRKFKKKTYFGVFVTKSCVKTEIADLKEVFKRNGKLLFFLSFSQIFLGKEK
jgi:hypothetical protein